MIDLNNLIVYAKVVDEGGFSAAARALGLPKSNVSRRVANLEARLGVRLLERTTRRIHTTEIGSVYYRHCKRIHEEAEHAEVSVSAMSDTPRGLLRVGASVTTGRHLISPVLAEFLRRCPGVQVDFVLSNRRIDIIDEGFDLVIRIGELEDSNLIAKHLGTSQRYLYASPAYLKDRTPPQQPADLAKHDCFAMRDAQGQVRWRLGKQQDSRTVTIAPRVEVNDFPSLRQIVLDGGGIGSLPSYLCNELERDRLLVRVLPGWSLPAVPFHALYPSHRGATPKVREFLEFISERIGERLNDPDDP